MNEFKETFWQERIILANYSGNNNPNSSFFASACLTNGCTHHKRGVTKGDAYYELELRRDFTRLAAGGSFWCPFTLGQVIRNLDDINEVIPFTYRIDETPEMFKIYVKMPNSYSYMRHFYVLTRIRYLYEFPQSALFYDVFRLKDTVEEFSEWSLQDLYNLVVSAIPVKSQGPGCGFSGRSFWYDPYHSIPKNLSNQICERRPNSELLDRINDYSALNSIYGTIDKIPVKIPYHPELFNSLAYWMEDDGFSMRLPYYVENSTLYLNKHKKKAIEVSVEYYEEKVDTILKAKIKLGISKIKAQNLVESDYQRRSKELENRKKEYRKELERLKNEAKKEKTSDSSEDNEFSD